VKCCEDISDGLVRDVSNIATASNVGFEIFLEKVPVAKELFFLKEYYADLNPYEMALTFGDDYELVFTASEEVLERVRKLGVKFAVIGRITADKRGRFIDANGKEVETGPGYFHLF
jgi:thiamine-monophosphate kinase